MSEEEDIELNRFLNKSSKCFECPICLSFIELIENAVEHVGCETIFHLVCINQCNECPICRKIVHGKVKRVNRNLSTYHSEQLTLKCKYFSNGCEEIVNFTNRKLHEDVCKYSIKRYECGCVMGSQEDFAYHKLLNCPSRIIKCTSCNKNIKWSDKNIHSCPESEFNNRCGHCNMIVLSKDMLRHENDLCSQIMLKCSYPDCNFRTTRKFLRFHIQRCYNSPKELCKTCDEYIPSWEIREHSINCHGKKCLQCDILLSIGNYLQHVNNDCNLRPIECNLCEQISTFRDIAEHQIICSESMVPCGRCSATVKGKNILSHRNNTCPDRIKCEICRVKYASADLPDHLVMCKENTMACGKC
eukprot:gene17656-24550_t